MSVHHIKWTVDIDCVVEGKPGESSEQVNQRLADLLSNCLKDAGFDGTVVLQGHCCRMVPRDSKEMN